VSFLLEAGGVYAVAALTYNYIGEKQVIHISCFAGQRMYLYAQSIISF